MSYTVLARKWRPMVFPDVIAQEHVTKTLENAISMNRVAHAYLFTGPRGVGKTTTARIFAKSLNCEKGPTITPCNVCSSCVEINESRSLDVLEMDGASNRGIDEVRNIRENVRYVPTKGKWKIYIIDEVHMLTGEAFNALLKTLEEPPSHVIFIFATTAPHKIPATILSRCQRFDFKRIPTEKVIQQLKKICFKEKIEISEDSLLLIAKKADGSMRDAQSLLDQAISFAGEKIEFEQIKDLLGIIEEDIYFDVADAILRKDIAKAYNLSEKILLKGYDPDEFMVGLIEFFRNLLIVKATNSTKLIESTEELKKRYDDVSGAFSEEDILRLLNIASEYEFQLKRSIHPMIKLDVALIKMVKLDSSVNIQDLLRRISGMPFFDEKNQNYKKIKEEQENLSFVSREQSSENSSKSDELVNLEIIRNKWKEIIERVKIRKISLGSFLEEGIPSKYDGAILEISFDSKNGFHIDVVNRNKKIISEAIEETINKKIGIKAVRTVFERSGKTEDIKKRGSDIKFAVENMIKKNPIIKDIIDTFDGEPIKLKL
ncbi:DNA polymerase III subunit gamma/tau [candidate division KSB1 bacterium]|nr:MAG: DNA polymerase III subunit gamma/tau [candidate division KSB1 bacterium]